MKEDCCKFVDGIETWHTLFENSWFLKNTLFEVKKFTTIREQ